MMDPLLDRRRFLLGVSCFGAAAALVRTIPLPAWAESVAKDPRVAEQPLLDKGFASVRKVGKGVYATISDFSKGQQTISNGGFIVGSEAALIIEGHAQPAGAAFELEALRMVSQVPVRGGVATHFHFDHTFGSAVFAAQGIPLWAHPKTAPLIVERYASIQGQDRAAIYAPFEKAVREAANDPVRRQRAEGDLGVVKRIHESADATVLALPNRTVDPGKAPVTIELGGLTATIEAYPPGHTPGDVVIRVQEQNITFTGDLVFSAMYPATFDGNMRSWRKALDRFAAFGKDALFVPGHGPVCGQEGIATLKAVMDDLANQAEKFHKAGVPVAEAQHRYEVPERFKNFPILAWSFCISPAIAKFYEEFEGRKS